MVLLLLLLLPLLLPLLLLPLLMVIVSHLNFSVRSREERAAK